MWIKYCSSRPSFMHLWLLAEGIKLLEILWYDERQRATYRTSVHDEMTSTILHHNRTFTIMLLQRFFDRTFGINYRNLVNFFGKARSKKLKQIILKSYIRNRKFPYRVFRIVRAKVQTCDRNCWVCRFFRRLSTTNRRFVTSMSFSVIKIMAINKLLFPSWCKFSLKISYKINLI